MQAYLKLFSLEIFFDRIILPFTLFCDGKSYLILPYIFIGTIHAGLLVLQPLKQQTKFGLEARSTGPSAPDVVSSASETSEERILEPFRLSLAHMPLVLAPEVRNSFTSEIKLPIGHTSSSVGRHRQPQVGRISDPGDSPPRLS